MGSEEWNVCVTGSKEETQEFPSWSPSLTLSHFDSKVHTPMVTLQGVKGTAM